LPATSLDQGPPRPNGAREKFPRTLGPDGAQTDFHILGLNYGFLDGLMADRLDAKEKKGRKIYFN
jgi:hypothetical protein